LEKTTEVASYPANPWGLYDMTGNVWEWVEDCKNDSYEGAPDDGSAWTSGKCGTRVLRGNSWSNLAESLRTSNRHGYLTGSRSNNRGFRVARTISGNENAPPAAPDLSRVETPAPTAPLGRVDEGSTQEGTRSPVPATPDRQEFRDCDGCPLMTVVPAGSFMMGSTEAERQWAVDQGATEGSVKPEKPQHLVRIAEPFAVSKYEVTFEEWDACLAGGGCSGYAPDDQDWARGRRPVIKVSWKDANKYTEWLSQKTGEPYRLLSEAEWEYAARAGGERAYWWDGADPTPEQANFGRNVGKTTEVGSYPANPLGLHDTAGNVWEWVADCWNQSYEGAPDDGSAWTSGYCSRRVLRGGSWGYDPRFLRSAYRIRNEPDDRSYDFGFRVARTLSRGDSVTP
jgi:formylglycine-generating enzyme required for sulfatase activity